ncbi:MAG: sporulation protein YqfD [Christensenellaceae bacterium]|jgi:hypothetical protein|nr:sporulation protein YqfD [Christensenellaceae bacterium]
MNKTIKYIVKAQHISAINNAISTKSTLFDVAKFAGEFCHFKTHMSYANSIDEVLTNKGCEYIREAPANRWKEIITVVVLVIGLIVGIISSTLYFSIVTQIDIQGTDYVAQEEIINALKEISVKTPCIARIINYNNIAIRLTEIDGISHVSVYRRGTYITIVVREELPAKVGLE